MPVAGAGFKWYGVAKQGSEDVALTKETVASEERRKEFCIGAKVRVNDVEHPNFNLIGRVVKMYSSSCVIDFSAGRLAVLYTKLQILELPATAEEMARAGVEPKWWLKSRINEGSVLPTDSATRKAMPIVSGMLHYFPRATAYVSRISRDSNEKHNPGEPLHWSKEKSNDHLECVGRHLIDAGKRDPVTKLRETGYLAWRSLAALETELEAAEARGEEW
jgi:hypothetical protein